MLLLGLGFLTILILGLPLAGVPGVALPVWALGAGEPAAAFVLTVILGGGGGGDMDDAPGNGFLAESLLGRGLRAGLTASGTPSGVGSFSFLGTIPGSEVLRGVGDC